MAAAAPIQLVVGLGNPGPRYESTRHNAGFWFLDALTRPSVECRPNAKFHADVGRLSLEGREIWLQKPTTLMNLSGKAVQALSAFYRIPAECMLVVHDDIDLPPGTVRIKQGGGHGGHNGLRDLTACLGPGFWRLRLGVGHPGQRDDVIGYVLSRPSRDEREAIDAAIDAAVELAPDLLAGDMDKAMRTLHRKPAE